MFSLQRYAVYIGLAVLILVSFGYYRSGTLNGVSTIKPQGRFDWSSVTLHYPVSDLTPLPIRAPHILPNVQFDFPKETPDQKDQREQRRAAVKSTFERCWDAYKKFAWGHDELAPISGGVKDVFGGWAATLVDNLDNLWIMNMKTDFDEAVNAAAAIDLGRSTLETVNVFETTIRHLGGFLSAYDLSGDRRCLEKAKAFGEMLLRAFDTPNHLPITRWKPHLALSGPQEADEVVLVAEIGSLEMEFTRLSQLTGDDRWYDAVARIIRLFDEQQFKTHLPGMWPVTVDAQNADFTKDTFFTLSAMSDSLYEYFPKMHALLGGVDPVYKKLYDGSMKTAIEHNLFRPMVPDNADILLSGNVRAEGGAKPQLAPQGQHLVCFAGGMFALGGKIFNEPSHVEIGKKLTNGCIWMYKNSPLGIMPEVFEMLPCENPKRCKWDEKKWKETVKSRQKASDADSVIAEKRIPKGFTELSDTRYILRPEAIESVFILYRITGDRHLLDAAWDMFTAITNATKTGLAHAAIADMTSPEPADVQMDSMESFWMAETLKYFYLIFSEPDLISLDEWVFNTEAHPFKRRVAAAQ
ncbi:glycoside hydrolase family 47 protein [Piedraia hortae CBS 480.64]|uniref:alpha-1,2-Mannosidase n=1 Tax=Piedraia hortae CBS 480.64 TaxID=1314780 RepID=A0A6A7BUP4_9PEZI|nr:glycoside hydrolase family 47 protein [Piedraia hortae CBS 480.64]